MANKIRFDVEANIAPVKQAANEIGEVFNKISLPANLQKSFNSTFQKLSQEIRNFEVQAERGFESLADSKKAQNSLDKILTYFSDLKLQARELSTVDLEKFFPKETVERLKKFNNLLKQTNTLQNKDNSKAVEAQTKEYEKAAKKVKELEDKLKAAENAKKKFGEMKKTAAKEYEDLTTKIQEARKEQEKLIEAGQKKGIAVNRIQSSDAYKQWGDQIKKLQSAQTSLTNTQQSASRAIDKYNESIVNLEEKSRLAKNSADEEAQALEREKIAAGATAADIQKLRNEIAQLTNTKVDTLPQTLVELKAHLNDLIAKEGDTSQFANIIGQINQKLEQGAQQGQQFNQVFNETVRGPVQNMVAMNSEMDQLKNRFQYFFSAINGIQLFKRAIRDAFDSVKELDAAMTEMAVVTDYTIGDIWGQIDQYTSEANKLGSTTTDVIKSMVLYTQQGLDMAQATQLSTETMKMARIAGLEGAEATDLMTAALRGFNMELNETSAQRVNDVYSNLAANAAANTHEIADAMTRTASIANAAGMEFETTAAFLTQMIETTRESAENLGTAMKTIIARFTEMKKAPGKIIEVDGEEVDVNKVETALKSAGIQARDTAGEFRDVDDVLLELSSKWDSLDKMSQRYIATTAAGSRQQSRFIAMMSNYQRTMELMGYATNSAGASQKQFEKTMESLESKLNRLHNAWEQFTTGITNAGIIKGAVDLLTNLLTVVNKITDALDPFNTGWAKAGAAILAFKAGSKLVNSAFKNIGTQIAVGLGKEGEEAGEKYSKSFIQSLKKNLKIQDVAKVTEHKQNANKYSNLAEKERERATISSAKYTTAIETENAAIERQKTAKKTLSTTEKELALAKKEVAAQQSAGLVSAEAQVKVENLEAQAKQQKNALTAANNEVETAHIATQEAEYAATTQNVMADKLEEKATKEKILAKEAEQANENIGLLTKAKYYAMMLFGTKTTRENARASLADAGSKFAQAGATGTATGAQAALNAAMMACPVGWILAAIAAIVTAITIFAAVHETTEEKVQRLNKSVEQLGSQMQETQETINDLTDSWDKLSDLKDDLDDLTVGTTEWKKKLIEVNQEVLNLLDKYPQLAQYVSKNANGELEINKNGYDKVLDTQLESLTRQQQAYSFAQALSADMQRMQLSEEHTYSYAEKQKNEQQMSQRAIERDSFFSSGIANLGTDYSDKQKKIGDLLTDEEKSLISTVSANEQSLKNFEKIKNKTSASVTEYARLTGLTEAQVKAKKDQNELDDDAIKTLIATNKYQKEYEKQAAQLVSILRSNNLTEMEKRAISGANSLTLEDVKNKDINDVFSKYIKDGVVKIDEDDSDSIKKILTDTFGFEEGTLNSLLEAGASLESIVQNFVNSEASLKSYEENLSKLGKVNSDSFSNFTNSIQKISKQKLSADQLNQLSETFLKVKEQGGDIKSFSSQLESIVSTIKKPEDLQKFISSLNSVDVSSETAIRTFTDNLSELGINLQENVKTQLVDAANAAKDFDISNIAEELMNFDLADKANTRKESNNRVFTADEAKNFKDDLQKKGYTSLISDFIQSGAGYVFKGNWDELINALLATKENKNAEKNYNDAVDDLIDKQKKYTKVREQTGDTPSDAKNKTVWDLGTGWANQTDYGIGKTNYTFDFKNPGQLDADYVNSLLYLYGDDGQIVHNPRGEAEDGSFSWVKIQSILEKAMTDEDFKKTLPAEFFTKLGQRLSANYSEDISDPAYQQANMLLKQLINSDGIELDDQSQLNDAIEKYNAQNSGNSWTNTQLKANQNFLKPYLDANLISQKEYEEWSKKTQEEISTLVKNITFDKESKDARLKQEGFEKNQYIGMTSARQIIDTHSETEAGLQAQKDAIDALVVQYDGYETKLKEIERQYGLTEDAAKQFLAIQMEQNDATDSIITTLSDYKDVLDEDNLSFTKGSKDYSAAIENLTNKFKVLFGDNITQEWVEDNLSTIKELSKGGKEAQDAMDKLANTSEAVLPSFREMNSGNAKGKIEETIFSKISASIKDATSDISTSKEQMTADFNNIKKALTKLDGSEATVEIKENTRAATMEVLKDSLISLLAQKLVTKDEDEISALEAKINTIKSLASTLGFSITEAADPKVAYKHGGSTLQWDNKQNKFVDIGMEDIDAEKFYTITDTLGTSISVEEVDVGKPKNDDSNKDTKDKNTWENDYDAQYNALKKIEALERKRTELEREQSRLTKRRFIDEQALMKNKQKQVKLLKQQAAINAELARSAESYLRGSGNGDVWYDTNTGTIQTNPNAAYYNEEQMEVFNKQLKMMEGYYDQMKSAKDNLADIYEQIEDLTEVVSELTDPTYNFDRIVEVLDNTLKNLEREITHLERTDSGATAQQVRRRYEQSAQTYVSKYNQDTNKKAIQEQQLNSLIHSDYSKYFTVDWATKQLTRTATYASITDPEMQKSVDTIIGQAQELCNGIIELDNDQKDIEDSLYDLKKNLADKALEFQEKVYEAVIHAREQAIENLKNIDTSINNAASELTSSIQKNIQKIRQDRQNQKTEEELQNMEARLSFLQTDTSNANQKNILDLEKQLSDKQESYTDSLIDQKISELQAQNDEAAKQRKRQIEVMEAQLEIDKENGVIWRAVDNAIKTGVNMSGRIQKGTELYNILSSLDEVTKMNATQIANWMGDLNNLAAMFGANATANLDVESQMSDKVKNADSVFGENSAYIKSLKARLEAMNNDGNFNHLMWYDQEGQKMVYKYSHYWASSDEEAKAYNNKVAQYKQLAQELANARAYYKTNKDRYMVAAFDRTYHYASGGLADYTGPAWLDGSKTSPELVLNPQDTENFLILKDVLANLINRGSSNDNSNGDNYFEIHIDVDKISGDYDVDQMVERVQQKIAEQSRYRNVNIINMMR